MVQGMQLGARVRPQAGVQGKPLYLGGRQGEPNAAVSSEARWPG